MCWIWCFYSGKEGGGVRILLWWGRIILILVLFDLCDGFVYC